MPYLNNSGFREHSFPPYYAENNISGDRLLQNLSKIEILIIEHQYSLERKSVKALRRVKRTRYSCKPGYVKDKIATFFILFGDVSKTLLAKY